MNQGKNETLLLNLKNTSLFEISETSLVDGVISLVSSEMVLNRCEPNAERVSKLSLPPFSVLQKNKRPQTEWREI